jgi:hypothetical protein
MTFDGTDDKGTCTQFSCGTDHTIEFWMDQATPSSAEYVLSGTTGGLSELSYDGTNMYYGASADQVSVAHGGMSSGTKTHWAVTRTGATVKFYKNNVQIGATKTLSSGASIFYVLTVGNFSTAWLSGKLAHLRIYNWVLNSTQMARQYNSGLGNDYLANGLYAVWEFDDTGGVSTTEDNQETTAARDLTIAGGAARAAW